MWQHMHDWGYGPASGGWWMMGLGWLIPLLVLGVLVWIAVQFGRRHQLGASPEQRGVRADRALDILRERYAKGEISREEFNAMKQDLE